MSYLQNCKAGAKGPISVLHPPRYFFLVEIKQMLNNKQVLTALQLNAFLSETESLLFLNIVIFNSHPKTDHKVFTGVCWMVFTGASQQEESTLAPAVLASWILCSALAAGCCGVCSPLGWWAR